MNVADVNILMGIFVLGLGIGAPAGQLLERKVWTWKFHRMQREEE